MKKFLASVMALAMILSLITVPTFAASCGDEEDDFFFEISEQNSAKGNTFHKIGYDHEESTLNDAKQWKLSFDVRSYAEAESYTQNRGGFGFAFSGTGVGFLELGYSRKDKAFKGMNGGMGAGANSFFTSGDFSYEFPTDGSVVNVAFDVNVNDKTAKVLINNEEIGTIAGEYIKDCNLTNMYFETIGAYVTIDNLKVQKTDTGTFMTDIDFSEPDVSTKYFVPDSGPLGANEGGAVNFIEATLPDDYYFKVDESCNDQGKTYFKIKFDKDVSSITDFTVSMDVRNPRQVGSDARSYIGFEIANSGFGFGTVGYKLTTGKYCGGYGGLSNVFGDGNDFADAPVAVDVTFEENKAVNLGLKKSGETISLLVNGEEKLTKKVNSLSVNISDILIGFCSAYGEVDNILFVDGSGQELQKVTFSENDINDRILYESGSLGGQGKVGAIDFIEAPSAHTWIPANCTTPRTCSVCGRTSGAALGHKADKDAATCTEAQLCTRENCPNVGKVIQAALGHDMKAATCTKASTCSRCDHTEGEPLGHTWQDATCTAPKTCSVCKETEGKALGHDYGATVCGQPGTCSRCNESVDEVPHVTDRKNPDCTHAVLCTRENCSEDGKVITPALGHNFTIPATCTTAKKCDRCGADDPDNPALGHKNLVHNRCGVCGRIAGTQDGPKSEMSSNTSDKVIHSDSTSAATNMVTKDKVTDFSFVMNFRMAAKNDGSTVGIMFNQAAQAQAYYNVDMGKFIIMAVKDGTPTNLAVSEETILIPADGVADLEFGLKRVGNKVTIYVDGVAVATAEDEVLAGESYLIPNFNGNDLYIDYTILANQNYYFSEEDEGYAEWLAAEIEAGNAKDGDIRTRYANTIRNKIVFNNNNDGQQFDMFAQWNGVEKEATMPDNWVRFGALANNYNFHNGYETVYNTAEDYAITMDVVFMSCALMADVNRGSIFYNFVGNYDGNVGIGVGYDFSNKVAFIKDVTTGYELDTKEFDMPMDEIIQWVVRLTNVKEEYVDNDGNTQYDDSTKVELIINGEVVVSATDPDLAHQGKWAKALSYRLFNVPMRIRGFHFTNDVENLGLATPHVGGSATCSAQAVCEECGKAYGALASDVHNVAEYTYNDDASCQKAGTKTGTCADCGEEITIADEDHPQIDHIYEDGKCTMCGAAEPVSFIWGDVDGSGKVESKDKVLASRYLAKWTMDDSFNKDAIDFDKDGEVKAADAVVLARYLAKWTGLPYPVGEPATNS